MVGSRPAEGCVCPASVQTAAVLMTLEMKHNMGEAVAVLGMPRGHLVQFCCDCLHALKPTYLLKPGTVRFALKLWLLCKQNSRDHHALLSSGLVLLLHMVHGSLIRRAKTVQHKWLQVWVARPIGG